MSTSSLSEMPAGLENSFSRLTTRLFMLTFFRGLGRWLTAMAVVLALVLLSDWIFDWNAGVRSVLLWSLPVWAVGFLWSFLIKPLSQSLSPVEKAALIDLHYPELRERLTSTVEFCDPNLPEEFKGSAVMRNIVLNETLGSLPKVDAAKSLPADRMQKALVYGLVAVAFLLVPFVIRPGHYQLLWSRLLVPTGNYSSATNLYFEIDNAQRVVARGTSVEIVASPRWRLYESELPESVWINRIDEQDRLDRSRMDWVEEEGTYRFNLPAVLQDFDYFLSADSAKTSEYHIQVEDAPEIASVLLEVEPPAYTGRAVETFPTISGRLAVFERSRLTMNLQFTKPVESLEFVWDEGATALESEAESRTDHPLPLPTIQLSEDRTSATLEMLVTVSGGYSLTLTDEFGLHNLEDAPHSLSLIRDQPPELQLMSAVDDRLEARSSDHLKVWVEASDDIAVGELELHLKLPDEREEVVPATSDELGVAVVKYQFALDLSPYGLVDGDRVTWRIRAADERPVPEPNVVWTSPRILSIAENAAPLAQADVEKRQDRWEKQLQSIREQLEANSELTKDIEKDARDSQRKKEEFKRGDEVPPLADQQWDLSGRLETLSLEFSNHQLYREMTQVLQEIARADLSPLSEELKTFPDREADKQPDLLRDNAKGVKQVAENLKQLEGVLETLAEIEKDLLELERLGDDTEKLADSAVALDQAQKELSEELAANPDLKESSEFLEKSDQLEQNYDALAEDQQKLTNALQDLLEKRPELVDAARKMEIDRLKQLAEDAKNLAEPQEDLAKQLEQEAKQLANESRQQRDQQDRLMRDEQQLLAEADRQSNQAAVPQLDRREQLEAKRDFQAGNLRDAVESQQDFAKELERLANDLEQKEALSENPKQAIEELAKREQELANQIQQAKEQADADPDETAKRERDLAKNQEAIAQALDRLKLPKEQQEQQKQASASAAEAGESLQSGEPDQAQQKAQQAADQLKQLAQQLPEDLPAQNLENTRVKNPEQVAKQAQRLAKDLEKLQRETERLASNPAQKNAEQQRKQIQQKQQNIARQVKQLPQELGRFSQQEAEKNLAQADEQLNENQAGQAAASQQQAKESLEEIAQKAQEMANAAKKPSEEMTAEQVADQLRQLAAEQQQLAQQAQQFAEQRMGSSEKQEKAQQQLADLQERQNQLAEQSAKVALESVRSEGAESESSKQAIQAAQEADQAARQLEAGLIEQSAQTGEKSASTTEEFAKSASEQPQSEELASRANELATQQKALSQELKQLSQTPAARQAAQQQAQQRMASEAQQLSEKFDLSAEKLQSNPFQLQQESDQAQQAGQESSQASRQMQQSGQNQQSANPREASQQAKQAAQNLQAAAESVDPQAIAESPVPQEVGEQVADAFQNLQKAQQMMQQAGQPQSAQSNPPSSSEQSQQSSSQNQPDGQQASQSDPSDQSRQRPEGTPQTPLQQTAQQLKEAAQQLQQAANQLQPNVSPEGEQQGDPNSPPSTDSGDSQQQVAKPGAGTELKQIELELQRLKKRNWGELSGKLQTEIMQSRQKNPNAEYAPLIKRYFEAIARDQSAVQKTPVPQNSNE